MTRPNPLRRTTLRRTTLRRTTLSRIAVGGVVTAALVAATMAATTATALAAPTGTGPATATPGAADPAVIPCGGALPFDPRTFHEPTEVDNRFNPLAPGSQITLVGTANRGDGRPQHTLIFTVTDLTKVVNGVHVVVGWDRDLDGGVLSEAELAFFAQDDSGRVWGIGEYPEIYENGRLTGAPDTWIAGVQGARAGVAMLGRPRLGAPQYLQGWAPRIDFVDCATVFRTEQHVCVPTGCYDHVLITDEINPHALDEGHQRKYYAPGVGNIKVTAIGGQEKETLLIRSVRHLCGTELTAARNAALALDRRAYSVAGAVYRSTTPAVRMDDDDRDDGCGCGEASGR